MATLPSVSSIADLDAGVVPHKDDANIRVFQFMGYPIYVGRNALSNDKLVAEHHHKNCLWFHASCSKGAHVVLCMEGRKEPDEIVIRRAAALALQFSKSPSHEVVYAPLIDVYRPQRANPGVFLTWRTTTVQL